MMAMKPASLLATAWVFCILLLSSGCATYEYDLTRPEQFATHIGRKQDVRITIDPLEYRFRTADNRLVIRIFNPTKDPIELSGGPRVRPPTRTGKPIPCGARRSFPGHSSS